MHIARRRVYNLFGFVAFLLSVAIAASAQNTIHVPANVPDIQDAIFAANNGDIILVSPGTYFGGFSFQGKNIVIESTDGPAVTTIDGGFSFSAIVFNTGEGPGAVLRGFTITHGFGLQEGGGIQIVNASPTIDGNVITANQSCAGGGISSNGGSAIIKNNTISNNSTNFCVPAQGGAGVRIVSPGNVQLLNNIITGNQETNGGNGGGVMIDVGAAPLVSGNLIQNNSANANGGGLSVNASAQLVNNVITGNRASQGGGIYSFLNQAQPSFVNNTVAGNSADQGAQLFIDGFDANVEIANNLLIDYTGTGSVFCGSTSGQIPAFDHDDVFSITPPGEQVAAYGGACSDVTGTSGNIQAFPQFANPASNDYHLLASSPALDAGNNSAPGLPAADLESNPRIAASNTATCAGIVDMGAYELVAPSTGTGFVSPSSLDFGTAQIGPFQNFPQTVTFFASQGCVQAAVQIHGSDFQQTSDCTALQAGYSCTIQVTFNPTAPGLRTGVLSVNLGPGTASVTAGLTGRGQNSGQISPANLNFGGFAVGSTSFTQSVTVFANSSLLQITNVSVTGDFSQSNFCTQTFGSSCSIDVTFEPAAVGLRTGVLTVTSNVGVFTVPLSGMGLSSIATIAPASLVFPSQVLNTTSPPQTLTLTNIGQFDLQLNAFTTNIADYIVQPVTCFGSLASGASCTYSVSFSPVATGERSGALEVNTNGGNVTVALDGSGTPPIAGLSPQILTFPPVPIASSSASQAVMVTNISGAPLQINSIGATNNFFSFSTCPSVLEANATCSIDVSFAPDNLGPYNGFLSFNTNLGAVTAVLSTKDAHNTLRVPADFPTINAAIFAANSGDTILVSPGTYFEAIDFQGKGITLASAAGAELTILDGQNSFAPVTISSKEPLQAALKGFTITHGVNGAIQVSNASPLIQDNIIINNVSCNNAAGAISLSNSAAVIRGNIISNNSSNLCGFSTFGGAILLSGTGGFGATAQILNNTITNNQDSSEGGGGIAVWEGNVLIQGNTIENNSTSGNGGGIFIQNNFSSADIVQNVVAGNSGITGGGIYEFANFNGQSPLILNNTVANNSSASAGTALFVDGADANVTVTNNILVDSAGLPAVACGTSSGQAPKFVSNDAVSLVPNTPAYGGSCPDATGLDRNIKQDPQFVNAAGNNYHLQPSSPVIDAGLIADNEPGQDLDGNGRVGPGNAQSCLGSIDMGAYEFQISGSGTPFLPSTFDFGEVPLSGSNSSSLVLSVSGCVQLSSVTTTGDFQQTNSCGGAVSSSLGCTIQITFTPTATGPRTGSLKFDFGGSAPAQTVTLTGTGFLEIQRTSPASLHFLDQAVGSPSAPINFTLFPNFLDNNFTTGYINGIWINGDFSQTNTCTGPSGILFGGCTFSITFTPTATGPRTGSLVISTNQGLATVPLSGTGIAPASATLTPASLVFPAQLVNTGSVAQLLTLKNTGTTPIHPAAATITGDFAANALTCRAVPLNPGDTCTYSIKFLPTAIGTRTGLFSVQSEAGLLSSNLSGTGIAPVAGVSPQSLSFGNQVVNTTSSAQALSLTNSGNANLNLSGITPAGDFAQSNNCTAVIAPGGSCVINVTFTPAAVGSRSGSLTMSSNAGNISVPLSGAGVNALATVTPSSLSFGSELTGSTTPSQTVNLTAGINTLQISSIAASGNFAQTNTCGASIAAGASCAIQVTFTPTVQGTESGSLAITSNEGTLSLPLSGNGIARAVNTIYVPIDQPTVQAAISAASTGQTVSVLPGTYTEHINFLGKAITVTSSDGPSATIINGSLNGTVVTFSTGEGTASVLSGFTITHGNSSLDGGGIVVSSASPVIQGNIITFNQGCEGIGIDVASGSPIIQSNTISHNTETTCNGGDGGGILLRGAGTPQILNNIITDNTIPNGGQGGAIASNGASPTISGNIIQRNSVFNNGGGISVSNSDAIITQNLITDNHATGNGGGISWSVPSGDRGPAAVNNTIASNTAANGSAIYSEGSVANVQVYNNVLVGSAGVAALDCDATFSSTSPVLANNDAFLSGGSGFAGTCATAPGTNGNVSVDPQFVDAIGGNYRLQATSPVIDAGDNSAPNLPAVDLDGNPRIAFGSATNCSDTVDLGAYEFVLTTTPAATLSPASFDFGIQPVGTASASQTFTLAATQGCISPSSIAISGDFTQTNNCSSPLGTGNSCAIQVSFAPLARGLRTGSLSISASGSLLTSSLTGQGGYASASFSPASAGFGNQRVQTTSAAQTIALTNAGNIGLQISSISVAGPFSQSNTCPATLAAGANCPISVTFTPAAIGPASGALTVFSNSSSSPDSVPLTGTGIAPIAVLTPSLSFGAQNVGTTSSQVVTLTNNGNAPLNISGTTTNGDFTAFSACPAALAAQTSCNIQVSFTPSIAGARTGSLVLTYDDPAGSQQSTSLSGTGLDFSVSASPSSVSVKAGSTAVYTAAVTGLGGNFATSVSLTCSGLPTGASCAFSPASVVPGAGSASSTLNLTTSSGQHGTKKTPGGTYTITIRGTAGQLVHSTTVGLVVQ